MKKITVIGKGGTVLYGRFNIKVTIKKRLRAKFDDNLAVDDILQFITDQKRVEFDFFSLRSGTPEHIFVPKKLFRKKKPLL